MASRLVGRIWIARGGGTAPRVITLASFIGTVVMLVSCWGHGNVVRRVAATHAWLSAWQRARACMLGDYGPDTATAVAVAWLVRDDCAAERTALRLPDDASPLLDVHDAVSRLRFADRSRPWEAALLDKIDAAAARARASLGLSDAKRSTARTVEILPRALQLPGDATDAKRLQFERGRILVDVLEDWELAEHVEIENVDRFTRWTSPRGYQVGYPSRSWAAVTWGKTGGSTLRTIELGATSTAPPPRVRDLPIKLEMPEWYRPIAAMDHDDTRVVILQHIHGDAFAVAISNDRGGHWRLERSDDLVIDAVQDRATGNVDVVAHRAGQWTTEYVYRFVAQAAWQWPEPIAIPRVEALACRDRDIAWAIQTAPGLLLRIGPTGQRTVVAGDGFLVADCRGDSALVLRETGRPSSHEVLDVYRGNDSDTVLQSSHAFGGSAALLDDGTWIYAAAIRGVVAVWRQHAAQPAVYRLPHEGAITRISVLGGVPYLVVRVGERYELVRLTP